MANAEKGGRFETKTAQRQVLAVSDSHDVQTPACDRCTQGVMDADVMVREFNPEGGDRLVWHPGNDHLYGRCRCECHA